MAVHAAQRKLTHDFNAHLATLSSYLENRQIKDAQDYIATLREHQTDRILIANTFLGCMLSSLCCELAALWTCEKATPAVAALLLILSLLMLRLAAPVNDINIHFDSNEMQALCTGMQKRLAVYAVISSMAFFVQPQAFGVLSASACVVALCVLFARMGLGITVIQ